MKKSIVWVCKEQTVNNPRHGTGLMDYSAALVYGDEIKFITRTDPPIYKDSSIRAIWEDNVCQFVNEYDPLTDFIVTTGNPAAIFMIGFALGRVGKVPRFLMWAREDGCYRVMDGSHFTAKPVATFNMEHARLGIAAEEI